MALCFAVGRVTRRPAMGRGAINEDLRILPLELLGLALGHFKARVARDLELWPAAAFQQ